MLANKLLSACGSLDEPLWVDSVFSAYTYTGNGTTQTINNGIDLAGKGGLVWGKRRNSTTHHLLYDDVRGITQQLCSDTPDTTYDEGSSASITSFNSNGFSLSSQAGMNFSGATYVSWTFRKAPKFFDVVTYTGDGSGIQKIPHSLGVTPGFIICKCTSANGSWRVIHRANGSSFVVGYLNTTDPLNPQGEDISVHAASSTEFDVGATYIGQANTNGATYVAYLFAHDPSADGIVQCGSFTTDGSGNATVNLGWEPQYVMLKRTNTTGSWWILDSARGLTAGVGSTDKYLVAESSSAEAEYSIASPMATGFSVETMGSASTYIYLAIRRPNKPPTLGTQVYNAIARTGTSAAAMVTGVGFAPDLVSVMSRVSSASGQFCDRLRGITFGLYPSNTGIDDNTSGNFSSLTMDGVVTGTGSGSNINAVTYINHFFKRAPGVFDIVAYTGTGVAHTEAHGLGVVPELIIVKTRAGTTSSWNVYCAAMSNSQQSTLVLNGTQKQLGPDTNQWNNTLPTASKFSVGTYAALNGYGYTYVAYLFATKAGVSKVFSYTGDGTQGKLIDCGFTTGSRFILIKRTDAEGDWFVFDSTRTYPAGNDPHLSLNTTAAEVTSSDDVDYAVAGFLVNQNATTNLNVLNGTYIGLSYA